MKFTIPTQEFNYLISRILNVVPLKPTMPILSNFRLQARDDEIILTATDLTVGIQCNSAEAEIAEEGGTTLNAKFLTQLLREISAPTIEFITDKNHVTTIKAGSSRFKIHGMDQSEFPNLPDLTDASTFTLSQKELKYLIADTSFAVSREDTRYVLTGVLMEVTNGRLSLLGTDGKRLAKTHMAIQNDPTSSHHCIVPLKAIDEIAKVLLEEGDATICIMSDKIAVKANEMLLVTKLLSGEYPDVSRVIPEKTETSVVLHREELVSLLRQISLFIKDQHHSVRFSLENHELKLLANALEIGEGVVSMPAHYPSPAITIALNPIFLLDILRHCKEETIMMSFVDAYNPVIITDGEQPAHFHTTTPLFVIMPMRLSDE